MRLIFFSQGHLNWNKNDEPVCVPEEPGVVGITFHQSRDNATAPQQDQYNGVYSVRLILSFIVNGKMYELYYATHFQFFIG